MTVIKISWYLIRLSTEVAAIIDQSDRDGANSHLDARHRAASVQDELNLRPTLTA